jgi:hypothetical protein
LLQITPTWRVIKCDFSLFFGLVFFYFLESKRRKNINIERAAAGAGGGRKGQQ